MTFIMIFNFSILFFGLYFVFPSKAQNQGLCSPTPVLTCDDYIEFVEIGTSNFNTLVQKCAQNQHMFQITGLSIDAMQEYLDDLPDLPNVVKKAVAVVGRESESSNETIFYVSAEDIAKHNLPWWLKGCNSIRTPHTTTQQILTENNLLSLMNTRKILVQSIGSIMEQFRICRTGLLKLDVEGMDVELLVGYVAFLWKNTHCYADTIVFEFNSLTSSIDQKKALTAIESVGYTQKVDSEILNPAEDVARSYQPSDDCRLWSVTHHDLKMKIPMCPILKKSPFL